MRPKLTQYSARLAFVALACLGTNAQANPEHPSLQHPIDRQTRECVRSTDAPAAIATCERQANQAWEDAIERHMKTLRERLANKPAALNKLEDSQSAWQAFIQAELALATQLYEQDQNPFTTATLAGLKSTLLRERALQLEGFAQAASLSDFP